VRNVDLVHVGSVGEEFYVVDLVQTGESRREPRELNHPSPHAGPRRTVTMLLRISFPIPFNRFALPRLARPEVSPLISSQKKCSAEQIVVLVNSARDPQGRACRFRPNRGERDRRKIRIF
jgi:hypothetical protein